MKRTILGLFLAMVMLMGVVGAGLSTAYATGTEPEDPIVGTEVVEPEPQPETVWVTYVDSDGTVYMDRTEFIKGNPEPGAPADPTREGYSFIGWIRSEDEAGNVTYTATWQENAAPEPQPETVWVTYVDEDGTVYLERTEFIKGNPEPGAPADPTREGYTFSGWSRSEDEAGNVTYTATWQAGGTTPEPQPETVWVTYVDSDGTVYMDRTEFTKGDPEPGAPADPTREGYSFTGWSRSVDGQGNITYTASWRAESAPEPETVWVTYVDSASSAVYLGRTTMERGGTEPAAPANPTRSGYTFTGWSRTVDRDGNITYTAGWRQAEAPAVDTRLRSMSIVCGELHPAFSPDVYSYTVYVTPDQAERSCLVDCTVMDSQAKVTAEGPSSVGRTDVVRKMVVTGGSSRSEYTIIVHVLTFREFIEDNVLFTMTDRPSTRTLPGAFTVGQITMYGEKVTAAQSTDGQLVLVQYLPQSDGPEPVWYRYEASTKKLYPVSVVTRNRQQYIQVSQGGDLLYGSENGIGRFYVYNEETKELEYQTGSYDELTVQPTPIIINKGFPAWPLTVVLGIWALGVTGALLYFRKHNKAEQQNTMYFRPTFTAVDEEGGDAGVEEKGS